MAVQIRSGQIQDNAIVSAKIADGAIDSSAYFGSSVVTSTVLANDSIVSAKIADGAIDTSAYLAVGKAPPLAQVVPGIADAVVSLAKV